MHKSRCRACKAPTPEMSKRFDPSLGYVCSDCYRFSRYADKALRKVGIEGSVIDSDRSNSSTPETP